MKKVSRDGRRGYFNGALRVETSVVADGQPTVDDVQVAEFLGNRELEDTMTALHEFFGLDFVLRRRNIGFLPKSEWLYELTAWYDDGFLFEEVQNDGPYSMCWTSVDLNDEWFVDKILDDLHGGLRLFCWDTFHREYVFIVQVPPFSSKKELEMKLELIGDIK